MGETMVRVEDLWKNYRSVSGTSVGRGVGGAGGGVSFSVARGEVFGLIGADGAGKTTLIRLLATLLMPDGGRATINGWDLVRDYREIRGHIGYMPGVFSLYSDLSVGENLRFFATLYNARLRDNFKLIQDIYAQIAPFRERKAYALSGGMKQKLALCCALIHAPLLLLLDEPTTGVDPVSRDELWSSLRRLARTNGVTVVVSTAYMDEAGLCDRIALMREGRLFMLDTPAGICARHTDPLFSVVGPDMNGLLNVVRGFPFVRRVIAFGDTHHVTLFAGHGYDELAEALAGKGRGAVTIRRIAPSVEDSFMAFAGEDA